MLSTKSDKIGVSRYDFVFISMLVSLSVMVLVGILVN